MSMLQVLVCPFVSDCSPSKILPDHMHTGRSKIKSCSDSSLLLTVTKYWERVNVW